MEDTDYKKVMLANVLTKTILSPVERLRIIYQV